MRSTIFPPVLRVRTDANLRDHLVKAADAERTTVRRGLRSTVAERSPTPDGGPGPFQPDPGKEDRGASA